MLAEDPNKHLEIKKNGSWELWLVSPTGQTILGTFPTLGELNQAQEGVRKQEERGRFLTHTYKKGKRHPDALKGSEEEE
jgi:hypothetical protein